MRDKFHFHLRGDGRGSEEGRRVCSEEGDVEGKSTTEHREGWLGKRRSNREKEDKTGAVCTHGERRGGAGRRSYRVGDTAAPRALPTMSSRSCEQTHTHRHADSVHAAGRGHGEGHGNTGPGGDPNSHRRAGPAQTAPWTGGAHASRHRSGVHGEGHAETSTSAPMHSGRVCPGKVCGT